MTYPFVAAKHFTAGGMLEPRAVVIHMAEGGGTVSWLTHPTNDNSSHFVIEDDGRVVQMVRDADASHSLHIAFDADANDASDFGIYGHTIAQAVLGPDGWADPNRFLFAVEIEGFAAAGPNAAQVTATKALIGDLRARHPSIRGLLGHRDFQDYKVCPGGRVPWDSLGGHGLLETEADMFTRWKTEAWRPKAGRGVLRLTPDRAAPVDKVLPDGTTLYTHAEVTTLARTDPRWAEWGNWRAVDLGDGVMRFALRVDFDPLVQGGDLALAALGRDFRAEPYPPVNQAALDAATLAGRRFEWDIQNRNAIATAAVKLAPKP